TWIARRRDGRVCLAHRVEPGAVAAIDGLRGLRHAHVAATLGVAQVEGAAHALVELRPAEPLSRLRDRLARAGRPGLPVPVMVRVAAQVADGVAALHARGLGHGAIDARRVAVEYGGGAVLLDTPQNLARGATAADDIAAIGRLIDGLCVEAPAAVVDLARRAREGAFTRAADLAAALDAWRRVDPEAARVDDARVARWMGRVCAARLEVWRAAGEGGDGRALDALVALIGAPRVGAPGVARAAVADTAEPAPVAPLDEADVFSSVSDVSGVSDVSAVSAIEDPEAGEAGEAGEAEDEAVVGGHAEVAFIDPTGALDAPSPARVSDDVFSSVSDVDLMDDMDDLRDDDIDDVPFTTSDEDGIDEAAAQAVIDAIEAPMPSAPEPSAPVSGRRWLWGALLGGALAAWATVWWWIGRSGG
ncbi:MAG: hypothetical protein H6705_18405, partial [Myxococcales bacterium]|nr:hypothetical protein [Myxococcales bacterium]